MPPPPPRGFEPPNGTLPDGKALSTPPSVPLPGTPPPPPPPNAPTPPKPPPSDPFPDAPAPKPPPNPLPDAPALKPPPNPPLDAPAPNPPPDDTALIPPLESPLPEGPVLLETKFGGFPNAPPPKPATLAWFELLTPFNPFPPPRLFEPSPLERMPVALTLAPLLLPKTKLPPKESGFEADEN